MKWTEDIPLKPGFYWVTDKWEKDPFIVEVAVYEYTNGTRAWAILEPGFELEGKLEYYTKWAGPLEPPEEVEECESSS